MPKLRPRPVRLRSAATVTLTAFAILVAGAARSAAATSSPTYYVDGASTAGACSDANTPAQAQSPATPWCTIGQAAASVPQGATIVVAPAVYAETVTLTPRDDGVTLRGSGATMPIVDGGGVRATGILLSSGVHDVTISGFDVRNLTASGNQRAVGIAGYDTYDDTITGNVVHAVHAANAYSYGIVLGNNAIPGLVHGVSVSGNRIYDIGPGGESMGIWLLMTTQMTIEGNEVYLVRKEGIRDWYGLDNSLVSNRLYLDWAGITLECAVGDYVANNVAYADVVGFDPKHVSDPAALYMWNLGSGQWDRFWHNTSYDNTHADFALGMNTPGEDYIDIEDNVLADPGDVHVHDFPELRGTHTIVDGNAYFGSAPLYYSEWTVPHPSTYSTLPALQAGLGWEQHGQTLSSTFAEPIAGSLGPGPLGMASGVALPDTLGAQIGAAGVPPATMDWDRYPAQVIASTAEREPYLNAQAASDGRDDSYWWSAASTQPSGSITFDLRAPKPVNTFVLDIFAQFDARNPKGVQIQVSNDGSNFTTVVATTNPDAEGSSYKYALATPVTARYVRLNLLSSFGSSTLIFSDFEIGLLTPAGSTTGPVAMGTALRSARSHHRQRCERRAHRRARGCGAHRRHRGEGRRGTHRHRHGTHHDRRGTRRHRRGHRHGRAGR